ncbi:protein of unknown function [Nitrospira japonica]|uniref:Uncharacterized protein n=1 Tax=Nitrospira japonica TaxID=1325564 RepID=A0A1W1IAB7_9BACT|nr:protein of unknown function [Nitrospira japonica]
MVTPVINVRLVDELVSDAVGNLVLYVLAIESLPQTGNSRRLPVALETIARPDLDPNDPNLILIGNVRPLGHGLPRIPRFTARQPKTGLCYDVQTIDGGLGRQSCCGLD